MRAIVDAILAETSRCQIVITRETANTIAIAAIKADRRALLTSSYGSRHPEEGGF